LADQCIKPYELSFYNGVILGYNPEMQTIKKFFKEVPKKYLFIVAVLVVVGLFIALRGSGSESDTVTLSRADFVKTVSVSGKVVAEQHVDLSFETSGTVYRVNKKAGDNVYRGEVIAALDASDVLASKQRAEADVLAARAELTKIESNSSQDSQSDADKQKLVNAISSAYTKSDDAVRNKVDQYFRDGSLSNPRITYTFFDYQNRQGEINIGRADVEKVLIKFKALVSEITASNYTPSKLADAKTHLLKVKSFLDLLAPAVNSFEVGGSQSQTSVDKYKSDLATARFNINESIELITTGERSLQTSVGDVEVQKAKVASSEAVVRGYDADLSKMVIIAPFSGVVSVQDAKVGESVSAHSVMVKLISKELSVEAYIPEISLPGLAVSNHALVTLDAYPNAVFDATVTHVDPAETVRDGVSNYKVDLTFTTSDPRVRSGLTGDVSIETEKRSSVLSAPERAIVSVLDKHYVYKKTKDDQIKTEVVLGARDGKGSIEVTSGVSEGDEILLNPPQN